MELKAHSRQQNQQNLVLVTMVTKITTLCTFQKGCFSSVAEELFISGEILHIVE